MVNKMIIGKDGDGALSFDALDEWCRERGYESESAKAALDYVSDIRSVRKDKDIPQW
jgi:hypothetical protein